MGTDDEYQGAYQDPHGTPDEPHVAEIRELATNGLSKVGHHGAVTSMGVVRDQLPSWDSIQIVTAQLGARPLLDDVDVATDVTIGGSADTPLSLDIPLFVSDMSFGALSQEAKIALARGAEGAGTGICSGEGGMLPEEQQENSRYFYELASGRFGWSLDKVAQVQAFHFKFGQGAKTGTGGHLPGNKVVGRIAEVRGLTEGTPAVSPATFTDLTTVADYRELAAEVRETSGGIPVGAKLSAQHIEADLDAALEIGVDYVILDGRGGGTGAAPKVFRDHISVPTIPALARARRHLDTCESKVTLVITGGLRTHADFVKALALGADADRRVELRHAGDRMPRDAGLQHRQLPGRDRHPEAGAAPTTGDRRRSAAPDPLLPGLGRTDDGARPGLRAHPRRPAVPRRPDDV